MSRKDLREGMTAAEAIAVLESDPEWVAAREREDREREQRIGAYDRAAEPLKAELASAGFPVDSIADLYNKRMDYEAVVPILLEWFPRIDEPRVKASVARALTVRWARPQAAPLMVEEMRGLRGSAEAGLRFAVANALSEVADDSVFEDVVELARDPGYPVGDRGVLVLALGRMVEHRDTAVGVLRELLSEDVGPHAVIALGELGATEARSDIERFLEHREGWVRKEARKVLRKLDAKGASA